jgi:hypothetical protein
VNGAINEPTITNALDAPTGWQALHVYVARDKIIRNFNKYLTLYFMSLVCLWVSLIMKNCRDYQRL